MINHKKKSGKYIGEIRILISSSYSNLLFMSSIAGHAVLCVYHVGFDMYTVLCVYHVGFDMCTVLCVYHVGFSG